MVIKKYPNSLALVLMNVLFLAIICLIILPLHQDRMFSWLDGAYMRHLGMMQHHGMSLFTYGFNNYQGLGDLTFPLLVNLIPASWLDLIFQSHLSYSIAVYTMLAVEYFIGCYLICRVFEFSCGVSIISSWVITLLLLPLLPIYHSFQWFYAITPISPYLCHMLFFMYLFICLFKQIGLIRIIWAIPLSLIAFGIIVYLLYVYSAGIVILVPFTGWFCITLLLKSATKYEQLSKTLFAVSTVLLLFLLNYFQFLIGLFLYSVPVFFPDNLFVRPAFSSISIIFDNMYPAGFYLGTLGITGMILTRYVLDDPAKKYAMSTLLYVTLLFSIGVLIYVSPGWYHGPHLKYFEYMLWPIYSAYAIAFVFSGIRFITRKMNDNFHITQSRMCHNISSLLGRSDKSLNLVCLLVMLTYIITQMNLHQISKEPKLIYLYPEKSPPAIIQSLSNRLSMKSGDAFRGYAATFYPKIKINEGSDWVGQSIFDSQTLMPKFGYPFRMVGLWDFDIPTLDIYSPLISPALFSITHGILTREIDQDIRNILLLTKPNIPLLQMFGVKYVFTNERYSTPLMKLVSEAAIDQAHGKMYLYEILGANIVSFTPNVFVKFKGMNELRDLIKKEKINFSREVYVSTDKTYKLSKLTSAAMKKTSNGMRLIASSSGTTALLIPLLYSHCIRYEFHGEKPSIFDVYRANMALTLIVFNKKVDVDIIYRYGLLGSATCRLKDRSELLQLIRDDKLT